MKNTLILKTFAAFAIAAATISCSKDNTPKSNYDKKMAAVTAEINATKQHDTALLLVTFGSTWDAPQETFRKMKQQFAENFPDMDVYFSFTSEICITRCAAKGWNYYAPSFYLQAIGQAGYKTVCVQSLHITPGEEYLRVQNDVKDFHNNGDHPEFADVTVYLAGPLLESQEDVEKVAALLDNKYGDDVKSGKIVAFMGHGNPEGWNYGNGNLRYTMLEEQMQKLSPNYFVATVDMEGNLVTDMIDRIRKSGKNSGEVICHPLMSIAGDHANNDMRGGVSENDPEEGSWRYELVKAGYDCPLGNCEITGLADYPEIVEIWISHMENALRSEPMYDPDSEE